MIYFYKMNIQNNLSYYIDATNEFSITSSGGGGGGGGGSGSSINSNIFMYQGSNLMIANTNINSGIYFRVYNSPNATNGNYAYSVKIDKDGKLYVYHVYDLLNPTMGAGWYDVEKEMANSIFNTIQTNIQFLAIEGELVILAGNIATNQTNFNNFKNLTNASLLRLSDSLEVIGNSFQALTTEATTDAIFRNSGTISAYVNNSRALFSTQRTFIQQMRVGLGNIANVITNPFVVGGVGIAASIFGMILGNNSFNYNDRFDTNSNGDFTLDETTRTEIRTSNYSNILQFTSNFITDMSNTNINIGFINSNVLTNQFIPSLKSDKVILGNITTPNAAYQMEMTGDINTNMLYINSTSLTSLLNQKQNNLTAVSPVYITTGNIGITYDSSLTKIGNNLSVVKTATAPLNWTGNNIALSYDNTLINNAGSLGLSIAAESKWLFSGGNIYNKALTNVGIGTDTALTYKLNVIGDTYLSSNTNIGVSKLSFISSYTNSTLALATGTNEYYLQYTGNGTLTLNEPCACDLLVVGAGGNGGTGANSGGGGAGEVIYYPNFPLRNGTLNINVGTSSTTPSNRISSITHTSGTQISAKGGGNGAFINNQNLFNLFKNKAPWGMYFAEDWSGTTLLDKSGNNRHATTSGTITKTTASGNGATGAITYISGNTSSTISWPTGSIPSTFTIMGLTRYTGGTRRRILQSRITNTNWLLGHWGGNRGVAFFEGWKTNAAITGTLDDWLCIIGKNSGTTPNNILVDGTGLGTATGGSGNFSLGINIGTYAGESSDWALSSVIIWDQALTDAEMVTINNMINQYKTDGVYIPNVINSFTSATSGGSGGGGGIIGTSSLGAIAGTKFDEYKSFALAGLNGTSTTGGNGGSGSSLYNTRFTTTITGSSLSVGLGGSGVGASPPTPTTKNNYGDGGDGNGGIGFQGVIIIRFKADSNYLQIKAIKDNANTGLILNANESTTPYQLRIFPWSDTYTSTGIPTRGWSFRCHDSGANLDLINLFSFFGGRVGIKTKNPNAVFDVNGDIQCKTFNVVGEELYGISCQIVNQHPTGQTSMNVFAGTGTNYGGFSIVYLPSQNLGYISCSKNVQIKTGNDAANSYIYINDTNGYVGIGITNPATKLGVNGMITANDLQINNGINATIISSGQLYSTGIDTNLINNLNGTITNVNNIFASNLYIKKSIDMQTCNILNCGYVYGGANWANEWKAFTNYYHKDDQGRPRIYFRNDPSVGITDHFTLFKSGSYSHIFADKDDTQYCVLDRFGISTYFPVTTSTTDFLAVLESNPQGTWQYRTAMIKFGSFTEFHRVFVDDELYINYDDFMSKYIGRVVVSTGKTKHAKKEGAETPWQILEDKEAITIDDAQPIVQLSRQRKDKRVYGVITYRKTSDYGGRVCANALGEGGLWIVNTNGNLENGDYLQTSDEIGYAEKQDDDIMRNYTIAKIIMDCDFQLDSPYYKCEDLGNGIRKAFVGVVYYCG